MKELNEVQFRAELGKDMPLVVDFWAEWCMPCKIFAPVMEEISDELDGKASFGKVNVDDERQLAIEFDIVSIPTLAIFKDGKEQERLIGVQKKDAVLTAIRKYL